MSKLDPRKIDDFEKNFIITELRAFQDYARNTMRFYTTNCFKQSQAEKLSKLINERYAKLGWKAKWNYDLKDKVYLVKCRR